MKVTSLRPKHINRNAILIGSTGQKYSGKLVRIETTAVGSHGRLVKPGDVIKNLSGTECRVSSYAISRIGGYVAVQSTDSITLSKQ